MKEWLDPNNLIESANSVKNGLNYLVPSMWWSEYAGANINRYPPQSPLYPDISIDNWFQIAQLIKPLETLSKVDTLLWKWHISFEESISSLGHSTSREWLSQYMQRRPLPESERELKGLISSNEINQEACRIIGIDWFVVSGHFLEKVNFEDRPTTGALPVFIRGIQGAPMSQMTWSVEKQRYMEILMVSELYGACMFVGYVDENTIISDLLQEVKKKCFHSSYKPYRKLSPPTSSRPVRRAWLVDSVLYLQDDIAHLRDTFLAHQPISSLVEIDFDLEDSSFKRARVENVVISRTGISIQSTFGQARKRVKRNQDHQLREISTEEETPIKLDHSDKQPCKIERIPHCLWVFPSNSLQKRIENFRERVYNSMNFGGEDKKQRTHREYGEMKCTILEIQKGEDWSEEKSLDELGKELIDRVRSLRTVKFGRQSEFEDDYTSQNEISPEREESSH